MNHEALSNDNDTSLSELLRALYWPKPNDLGVLKWSMTDVETYTSLIAMVERGQEDISAHVMTQTLDGNRQPLWSAAWRIEQGRVRLVEHRGLEGGEPMVHAAAVQAFRAHVQALSVAPKLLLTGEVASTVLPVVPGSALTEDVMPSRARASMPQAWPMIRRGNR